MSLHRIRLRGSWDVTPLEEGRTRYARRFGRPRTLDPGQTVWLTGTADGAAVTLNGEPLGSSADGSFTFDVTARLRHRNEVVLEMTGPAPEDVALEIRG